MAAAGPPVAARQVLHGVLWILGTGAQGGLLRDSVDILLDVASRETPRIQECHILIGHVLCEIVEHDLFA